LAAADDLISSGDVGAIRAEHERFAELSPGNPEMAFRLGVSLAAAGKLDEARATFDLAYAVSPNWAELLRRLPAAGLLDLNDDTLRRLTPERSRDVS
jgi:Flp pilus assembly protein TadD